VFLSKAERAALALKKRQEAVEAQRKALDEERTQRDKYLEEAGLSGGGARGEGRRRWEERGEEKERLREEGVTLKDKEKEMEAIKVRGEGD